MPKIATILHYCTNEYRFLDKTIEQCAYFSDQIIIPFADRFFNNTPENRFLLEVSMERHPNCLFINYPFDVKQLYSPFMQVEPSTQDWLCCWHSTSRYVGSFYVNKEIEWIFFLDADELVEGKRFQAWTEKALTDGEQAYWFYAYQYGLSAAQRKEELQLTGLLLQKNALRAEQLLNIQERCGMYQSVIGQKKKEVLGLDQQPLIHHYSWVRSPSEQQQKAMTWAKKEQKNWLSWLKAPVEQTTSVTPFFDPLSISIPSGTATFQRKPNEHLINRRQLRDFEHALL